MISHVKDSKPDNGSDPRLRGLLNEVFAYVTASRPEYDLQIFADNASQLLRVLGRENEQQKALSPQEISRYREQLMDLTRQAVKQHPEQDLEQDFGMAI